MEFRLLTHQHRSIYEEKLYISLYAGRCKGRPPIPTPVAGRLPQEAEVGKSAWDEEIKKCDRLTRRP
jgi:hypothetical protein